MPTTLPNVWISTISSFATTEQEAIQILKEAIELYLEDIQSTEIIPNITDVTVGELAIA